MHSSNKEWSGEKKEGDSLCDRMWMQCLWIMIQGAKYKDEWTSWKRQLNGWIKWENGCWCEGNCLTQNIVCLDNEHTRVVIEMKMEFNA